MSDASDIFEELIAMMLMKEMNLWGLMSKIEVDEAEICKAEKMYEKEARNYRTLRRLYLTTQQ